MSNDKLIKQVKSDDNQSILDRQKLDKLLDKKQRAEAEKFFTKVLHLDPTSLPKLYKGIKIQNNTPYIPISYVEMLLDEIFFGQWKTHSFGGQQIANEVVGWITLEVKHPVTGEWITRVGSAGKQIQQASKTPIIEFAQHKYANCLEKIWPAMKSECIKNGAKSLGRLFGRDLGRDEDEQSPYTPLMGEDRAKKVSKDLDDLLKGDSSGDGEIEDDNEKTEDDVEK